MKKNNVYLWVFLIGAALAAIAQDVRIQHDKLIERAAVVLDVHDGDTVLLVIDLTLDVSKREWVRLEGLDAPELNTEEGKRVTKFLTAKLLAQEVVLVTKNDKREKYGRLLGTIFLDGESVNKTLLDKGMAKPYDGGRRTSKDGGFLFVL